MGGAHYALFERIGIEVEYMLVDRDTLDPRPWSDRLLLREGRPVNRVARGPMSWSNELAAHLIEVQCAEPLPEPASLAELLPGEVAELSRLAAAEGCRLLPGAMHPWFDPRAAAELWAHEDHDIYQGFDRIFDCRRHAWANVQSMHINLPFADDDEFHRLHSAVRLILPLIPGLAASSPLSDGAATGTLDTRLMHYVDHCAVVPDICGLTIPDVFIDQHAYQRGVYEHIDRALVARKLRDLLDPVWVNARGAIARFDRQAIEIRLVDSQECPRADLAVATAICAVVRALVEERWAPIAELDRISTPRLRRVLDAAIIEADEAPVGDRELLEALGWPFAADGTQREIWHHLLRAVEDDPWWTPQLHADACTINDRGCLARCILETVGERTDRDGLRAVYAGLADCLQRNEPLRGS